MNTAMVPVVCAIDLPTKRNSSRRLRPYLQAIGEEEDASSLVVCNSSEGGGGEIQEGRAVVVQSTSRTVLITAHSDIHS